MDFIVFFVDWSTDEG